MTSIPLQALLALLLFLGVSGGGFYMGYRYDLADVVEAKNDLATVKANEKVLQLGMDKCNASADAVKAASDKLTASAQSTVDELNKERAKYTSAIAAIEAIHSTDEKCAVANAIMLQGFR